jgi:predicted ATPase
MLRGWALAEQGQGEEGITLMCQGLAAWRATGAAVAASYFLALLIEAYRRKGQVAEGLDRLAEALEIIHKTGEGNSEAEIYRLKGELLLQQSQDNSSKAEACFLKAIEVAQRQQAKSLELRSTVSLARLWQAQGKHHEARDRLATIYNWFTEGFDTKDLQEAKVLLHELA